MSLIELTPLVVAFLAFAGSVTALLKGRKLEKADAADKITKAAAELVEKYRTRIAELESIVVRLESRIEELTAAAVVAEEYKSRLTGLECTVESQQLEIEKQRFEIEKLNEKRREMEAAIGTQHIEGESFKRFRREFILGVRALTKQIRSLGHVPVWEPDTEDE
jgi:flagellar biosynthesis chaperone FliJ